MNTSIMMIEALLARTSLGPGDLSAENNLIRLSKSTSHVITIVLPLRSIYQTYRQSKQYSAKFSID